MKKGFEGVARIYALTDLAGDVFYVGCTVMPLTDRLRAHITEARKNDPWANLIKNDKIRSLDYNVFIRQLDEKVVKGKNRYEAQRKASFTERCWIRRCLDLGYILSNRVHAYPDYNKGSKARIKKIIEKK